MIPMSSLWGLWRRDGRWTKTEVRHLPMDRSLLGSRPTILGLVDTLGGLHEAVNIAAELANIKGDISIVRPYRREKSPFLIFLGSSWGNLIRSVGSSFVGSAAHVSVQ